MRSSSLCITTVTSSAPDYGFYTCSLVLVVPPVASATLFSLSRAPKTTTTHRLTVLYKEGATSSFSLQTIANRRPPNCSSLLVVIVVAIVAPFHWPPLSHLLLPSVSPSPSPVVAIALKRRRDCYPSLASCRNRYPFLRPPLPSLLLQNLQPQPSSSVVSSTASLVAPIALDPTSVCSSERIAATVVALVVPYRILRHLLPSAIVAPISASPRCQRPLLLSASSLGLDLQVRHLHTFFHCPMTTYALSMLLRLPCAGPPLSVMPAASFSARLPWPLKSTVVRPSPWLTAQRSP
ncbi:hypothetical protein BHE74_00049108 [Ensete ventricosum]|nr:hypothetical protein BHE74_00049108 [Ensete ventricosum]